MNNPYYFQQNPQQQQQQQPPLQQQPYPPSFNQPPPSSFQQQPPPQQHQPQYTPNPYGSPPQPPPPVAVHQQQPIYGMQQPPPVQQQPPLPQYQQPPSMNGQVVQQQHFHQQQQFVQQQQVVSNGNNNPFASNSFQQQPSAGPSSYGVMQQPNTQQMIPSSVSNGPMQSAMVQQQQQQQSFQQYQQSAAGSASASYASNTTQQSYSSSMVNQRLSQNFQQQQQQQTYQQQQQYQVQQDNRQSLYSQPDNRLSMYSQPDNRQSIYSQQDNRQSIYSQQSTAAAPPPAQSNLSAGSTTVVTSQLYYADSNSSRMGVIAGQPPQHNIQQYPPAISNTPASSNNPYQQQFAPTDNLYSYAQPQSRNHSFSSLSELEMRQSAMQTPVSAQSVQPDQSLALIPKSNSNPNLSPKIPKTSILSHADGSLMLQEVFVSAGEVDELSGYAHGLDLQGIWARVKVSSSSSSNQTELRLALRMNNSNSSSPITNLEMAFQPNSFGLSFDPSLNLLSGTANSLSPGKTHTHNVLLFCSPENQKISDPNEDLSAMTVNIKYQMGSVRMFVTHRTFVPLHIFFIDHPQSDPTNYVSDPDSLSCTDDGPRLTQSSFLSIWPSQSIAFHQFSFEKVNWKRWYTSYAQSGVLQAITGVTFATANPSNKEVIKVIERKLSTNRIYVVASREAANPQSVVPSLVFFCSFKVGDLPVNVNSNTSGGGSGVLILAEIKLSGDDWGLCECKLKSVINSRLWGGLQRAVRAVLLS